MNILSYSGNLFVGGRENERRKERQREKSRIFESQHACDLSCSAIELKNNLKKSLRSFWLWSYSKCLGLRPSGRIPFCHLQARAVILVRVAATAFGLEVWRMAGRETRAGAPADRNRVGETICGLQIHTYQGCQRYLLATFRRINFARFWGARHHVQQRRTVRKTNRGIRFACSIPR